MKTYKYDLRDIPYIYITNGSMTGIDIFILYLYMTLLYIYINIYLNRRTNLGYSKDSF